MQSDQSYSDAQLCLVARDNFVVESVQQEVSWRLVHRKNAFVVPECLCAMIVPSCLYLWQQLYCLATLTFLGSGISLGYEFRCLSRVSIGDWLLGFVSHVSVHQYEYQCSSAQFEMKLRPFLDPSFNMGNYWFLNAYEVSKLASTVSNETQQTFTDAVSSSNPMKGASLIFRKLKSCKSSFFWCDSKGGKVYSQRGRECCFWSGRQLPRFLGPSNKCSACSGIKSVEFFCSTTIFRDFRFFVIFSLSEKCCDQVE